MYTVLLCPLILLALSLKTDDIYFTQITSNIILNILRHIIVSYCVICTDKKIIVLHLCIVNKVRGWEIKKYWEFFIYFITLQGGSATEFNIAS